MVNLDDPFHRACVDAVVALAPPLLTCWPVITEAAWLLRRRRGLISKMLLQERVGSIRLLDLGVGSMASIEKIVHKYADLPADLADAALMHLAHRERIDTILTLDQRDFSVYRLPGGKRMKLVSLKP